MYLKLDLELGFEFGLELGWKISLGLRLVTGLRLEHELLPELAFVIGLGLVH